MKNKLPFFIILLHCLYLNGQELACEPDTAFAEFESFVFPSPLNPATGSGGIEVFPACIGEPYELTFNLRIGDSATIQGFTLDFVSAKLTGIEGLPSGIEYFCNPPDCVFADTILGCITLQGIPMEDTPIDTHQLTIFAEVKLNSYGTIPITVPGDIIDFQYNLVVEEATVCNPLLSIEETLKDPTGLRNFPNPAVDQTTIEVTAWSEGNYLFEVFDLTGKRVHQASTFLSIGPNAFDYETDNLDAGLYIYSIRGKNEFSRQKMVVTRL